MVEAAKLKAAKLLDTVKFLPHRGYNNWTSVEGKLFRFGYKNWREILLDPDYIYYFSMAFLVLRFEQGQDNVKKGGELYSEPPENSLVCYDTFQVDYPIEVLIHSYSSFPRILEIVHNSYVEGELEERIYVLENMPNPCTIYLRWGGEVREIKEERFWFPYSILDKKTLKYLYMHVKQFCS
jgi:hypothetical protein